MFKDGAFTSNDRDVRRLAIQKTLRVLDAAADSAAQCSRVRLNLPAAHARHRG